MSQLQNVEIDGSQNMAVVFSVTFNFNNNIKKTIGTSITETTSEIESEFMFTLVAGLWFMQIVKQNINHFVIKMITLET